MAFDYKGMQKTAQELLSPKEFGSPLILLKKSDKKKYDSVKKKEITSYEQYQGVGVVLPIPEEAIGALVNLIKAGDKRVILQMTDSKIIPIETKDKIVFEDETYNILSVKTLKPNGKRILIHTLIVRKSDEASDGVI